MKYNYWAHSKEIKAQTSNRLKSILWTSSQLDLQNANSPLLRNFGTSLLCQGKEICSVRCLNGNCQLSTWSCSFLKWIWLWRKRIFNGRHNHHGMKFISQLFPFRWNRSILCCSRYIFSQYSIAGLGLNGSLESTATVISYRVRWKITKQTNVNDSKTKFNEIHQRHCRRWRTGQSSRILATHPREDSIQITHYP